MNTYSARAVILWLIAIMLTSAGPTARVGAAGPDVDRIYLDAGPSPVILEEASVSHSMARASPGKWRSDSSARG
jgi:hypothetical protein